MDQPRYISVETFAAAYDLSCRNVYRLLAAGALPGRRVGRLWRLPAWLLDEDRLTNGARYGNVGEAAKVVVMDRSTHSQTLLGRWSDIGGAKARHG